MNPLSSVSSLSPIGQISSAPMTSGSGGISTSQSPSTREAFQDFVAGTFYQQMLKAMRSGQSKVHYLDGGQAEKMFRSQLDQHLAESLAREHGADFAEPLFPSFQSHLDSRQQAESAFDQFA